MHAHMHTYLLKQPSPIVPGGITTYDEGCGPAPFVLRKKRGEGE